MEHNELTDSKHRLAALEAGNQRMAVSMEAVMEKLETIIEVIRGNLKTPEVPGLMHRMAEMRAHQQVNTIALAETKALVIHLQQAFDDYRSTYTKNTVLCAGNCHDNTRNQSLFSESGLYIS